MFFRQGFEKIQKGLSKTKKFLRKELFFLFAKPLDKESLEKLEKIFYEADLGSPIVSDFLKQVQTLHKKEPKALFNDYLKNLQKRAQAILEEPSPIQEKPSSLTRVFFLVGSNGSGKTTSIAKLAYLAKQQGKRVLIAAADTFRAAATEQLEIWTNKIGIDLVKGKRGSASSAVLYDALTKATTKSYTTLFCDTAGRLESKTDLMHELKKLHNVARKFDPTAPHDVYLTIDTNLGQTILEQTRIFHEFTPLTGLILTKMDGSAKGGIALALYKEFKIPIRFVTFGENIEDIAPFNPKTYTEAIFSE